MGREMKIHQQGEQVYIKVESRKHQGGEQNSTTVESRMHIRRALIRFAKVPTFFNKSSKYIIQACFLRCAIFILEKKASSYHPDNIYVTLIPQYFCYLQQVLKYENHKSYLTIFNNIFAVTYSSIIYMFIFF